MPIPMAAKMILKMIALRGPTMWMQISMVLQTLVIFVPPAMIPPIQIAMGWETHATV